VVTIKFRTDGQLAYQDQGEKGDQPECVGVCSLAGGVHEQGGDRRADGRRDRAQIAEHRMPDMKRATRSGTVGGWRISRSSGIRPREIR
jgi:hypothetical protein